MDIKDWCNKKIAVWGWGREGKSIADFLFQNGIKYTILDSTSIESKELGIIDSKYQAPVIENCTGADLLLFDIVVKSPGISLYCDVVQRAQQKGVVFTSATNIWFAQNPSAQTIVVTGTKGKSTTSSLIAHLLKCANYNVVLAGNIGIPLLSFWDRQDVDIWVIELSSYQIADLNYCGKINILLNLYPEHIDWHGGLKEYFSDKLRIITKCSLDNYIIVDKEITPMVYEKLQNKKNIRYFNDPQQFHIIQETIYDNKTPLFSTKEIPLRGNHNHLNICAALTAIKAAQIPLQNVISHLKTFQPLPHRLDIIAKKNDTLYVDDCISTTPESTIAAIKSFPKYNIILLVGGFDRGLDWQKFAISLTKLKVKHIITMYQSGQKIYSFLSQSHPSCFYRKDLKEAIALSMKITSKNNLILLSPGAPSYDAFNNFEEKGKAFLDEIKKESI